MKAKQHDVIQLDPEHCEWGPLLCIVDDVKEWGVLCYAMVAHRRNRPPRQMYVRAAHEHYLVIGHGQWFIE